MKIDVSKLTPDQFDRFEAAAVRYAIAELESLKEDGSPDEEAIRPLVKVESEDELKPNTYCRVGTNYKALYTVKGSKVIYSFNWTDDEINKRPLNPELLQKENEANPVSLSELVSEIF
jgi:hypothetical protein